MSWPVILLCLWALAGNIAAMFPSPRRHHWPTAYALLATYIPLIAWCALTQAWWVTLLFVAIGASMLRWPILLAWRWLIGRIA